MLEVLWQGLLISLMGISLTFLALGLLIVVMILLERFTRPKTQPQVDKVALDTDTPTRNTADEEIVAAIAVAVARMRSATVQSADLGVTLEAGPGAWWTSGRSQLQTVNTPRTARWRC